MAVAGPEPGRVRRSSALPDDREETTIEAVRVWGSDEKPVQYRWDPNTWYLLRDDYPYLDVLIRGNAAQAEDKTKLEPPDKLKGKSKGKSKEESEDEVGPDGAKWQRWDLQADLSWRRQLGEISLPLKVPKNCTLRCYIVPTLLLGYPDLIAMVEDIKSELGVDAAWDTSSERPGRAWSRPDDSEDATIPPGLVDLVDEELRCALSLRRDPFTELGPQSRRGFPLAENAIVSHWAVRRYSQLPAAASSVAERLEEIRSEKAKNNPDRRQEKIENDIKRLVSLQHKIADLTASLGRLVNDLDLGTVVYPSPVFQRDYRLRQLLRAFAPPFTEVLSADQSARSHYPPVILNCLWELWGAVWLAKAFRNMGFRGNCTTDKSVRLKSCSWRFQREDVVLELDYEAAPALVDYKRIPPVHDRDVPALEWAARNQNFDLDRPFFGSDPHCSPDYMLRITTCKTRSLVVGDACLASPKHHPPEKAKPRTVERYRQTLGWAIGGEVVRCHLMGAFVIFPSPATAWEDFQRLPGASDCTLLCPSPRPDAACEASQRLRNLLITVAPEILQHGSDY